MADARTQPIRFAIAKVETTEHSGRYYYYYVGNSALKPFIPEKKFLQEVKDAILTGAAVTITRTVEPKGPKV